MTTAHQKTLLFDLDGTLVDSFPGIKDSFLRTLVDLNWPIPSAQRICEVPGPPMEWTLADLGMNPEQVIRGLEIYLAHYGATGWENAHAFSGMRELLFRLKAQGFRICTATSKGEYFAEKALEKFDLLGAIDFLGAAEEHGKRRSKSAVIAHVISSLDLVDHSHILMIGDRSYDILGARDFGISSVAVTWGYGCKEEWDQANYIAHSATELERIINEWS